MPTSSLSALLLASLLVCPLFLAAGCAEDDVGSATQTTDEDAPPGAPAPPPNDGAPAPVPGEGPAPNPPPGNAPTPNPPSVKPNPTDQTAPEVVAVHPAADAAKVFLDAEITARFDEPIDPATVTPDTFVVTNFRGRVAGSLRYEGETILFTPSALLVYNSDHTVTVAGVTDVSGNALAKPYQWRFRTGTCRSNFC